MSPRIETIGDHAVTFVGDDQVAVIYAMRDDGHSIRYVGSTTQKLRLRIRAHLLDVKTGSQLPVHRWLRTCRGFTVEVLARVPAAAREAHERYWVSQFNGLLNLTDGGPGMSGHRFAGTEHARRIAIKIRTAPRFNCHQCGAEFHRKVSQAQKFSRHFCSRDCYAASNRKTERVAA